MTDTFKGIITADGKKRQLPYGSILEPPVSDTTLTIQGGFADSKVVGDKFKQVKAETNSLKEDKADKTSLAQTDRKLDALWKLNQGISYEFQTDEAEAYQKTVPSGAKMASVKSIGGRTIVWNQLLTNISFNNVIWNSLTINGNSKDGITITGTASTNNNKSIGLVNIIKNHKYLVYGVDKSIVITDDDTYSTQEGNRIFTATNSKQLNISFYVKESSEYNAKNYPMLFDLTQMFGSGNEPSTTEEFEAMFPADYYPYNAGELMSAPVNEVVEQGRNLFDCYGFSCTSIPNIAAKRDIANEYGTTISTIDPTNRLIVTQDKADGSAQSDYRNGYFTIGIRGLKYNTNYILAFDFTPTKMLIVDPIMKMFANGTPDSGNSVSDFTLNVKKHVTIKFVYNANNDAQFLELRNSGMSGIIENFQIEEGTTATTYSPYHKTSYPIPQAVLDLDGYGESGNFVDFVGKKYHKGDMTIDISDIIGDTFQEPLEVEAGGTLTFKNSHGDDYRIPVPSSEEYVISLAEVEK